MYLKAGDILSGNEGRAYTTINGQVEEAFYFRNVEAVAEKQKSAVKVLNRTGAQHKANGWEGTGSATIYYVTSVFRKMMLEYIKTGRDTYFDFTFINEGKGSTIGKQETILRDCNLDSVVLAKLDVDAEELDEDISFTFDDVDMPSLFVTPTLGR
ncbi:phage tail tube protein [Paenibacillus shunpengii]|uniref:Phage tail tube protein n=1 Tax=Paenibacillus shunpengii TaxID=2054424 RepID=A0ABW5SXK3_9BACL